MKKRLLKKRVSKLSNSDLYETVAYENGLKLLLAEKEFDKRIHENNNSEVMLNADSKLLL